MTGLGIVHAPMLREKNGARRARKGESLALRERGGPLHPAHFVSEYFWTRCYEIPLQNLFE